jgi:hypothetical protein
MPPPAERAAPSTPLDRHPASPKAPESADVRMLAETLLSPNMVTSPTATLPRSGMAKIPSSK